MKSLIIAFLLLGSHPFAHLASVREQEAPKKSGFIDNKAQTMVDTLVEAILKVIKDPEFITKVGPVLGKFGEGLGGGIGDGLSDAAGKIADTFKNGIAPSERNKDTPMKKTVEMIDMYYGVAKSINVEIVRGFIYLVNILLALCTVSLVYNLSHPLYDTFNSLANMLFSLMNSMRKKPSPSKSRGRAARQNKIEKSSNE